VSIVSEAIHFQKLDSDNHLSAFLLNNGTMYHVANGTALLEYLLTLYFKPTLKSYPYVSLLGKNNDRGCIDAMTEQPYRYNSRNRRPATAFDGHDSRLHKFLAFCGFSKA
jgi:hypothetical protein